MIQGRFNRCSRFAAAILISLGWPAAGHATLYVIVLDKQGITIASDSRRITITGQEIKTSDGFEKVIALGPKLAFMSSGLTEIAIGTSVVRASQLVRKSYAESLRRDQNVSVKALAVTFGRLTTKRLNEMSCSQKARVAFLLRSFFRAQDNQVMEAIIAGLEGDGGFKAETVDFYLSPRVSSSLEALQFEWTVHEAIADDNPRVILSGEVSVLQSALQDGAPPIGHLPSFEAWWQALHQPKHLDASDTAEALLNLAIKYPPQNQPRLGYPIFVYTLNAQDGLRRVRIVPEGKSVDLPH
jgi:hypothetical protein